MGGVLFVIVAHLEHRTVELMDRCHLVKQLFGEVMCQFLIRSNPFPQLIILSHIMCFYIHLINVYLRSNFFGGRWRHSSKSILPTFLWVLSNVTLVWKRLVRS